MTQQYPPIKRANRGPVSYEVKEVRFERLRSPEISYGSLCDLVMIPPHHPVRRLLRSHNALRLWAVLDHFVVLASVQQQVHA